MNAVAVLSRLREAGLEAKADGNKLLVGPGARWKLTPELRELVRAQLDGLWAIAVAEAIVRARPNVWRDPQPDICHFCGATAVGYTPRVWKACEEHLGGGTRWT